MIDLVELDALAANPDAEFVTASTGDFRELIRLARFGQAWEAAEAAAPQGWRMAVGQDSEEWPGPWTASTASLAFFNGENDDEFIAGEADTPAAALHALAAKLREQQR